MLDRQKISLNQDLYQLACFCNDGHLGRSHCVSRLYYESCSNVPNIWTLVFWKITTQMKLKICFLRPFRFVCNLFHCSILLSKLDWYLLCWTCQTFLFVLYLLTAFVGKLSHLSALKKMRSLILLVLISVVKLLYRWLLNDVFITFLIYSYLLACWNDLW